MLDKAFIKMTVVLILPLLLFNVTKAETGRGTVFQFNPTIISGPSLNINYQITNNIRPAITGGIDNPDANVYVTVNNIIYRGVNNGDGTWAAGVSDTLSDGVYDVTIVATSGTGAKLAMTVLGGITIDTVAPRATISNLTSGSPSPILAGTVDDNGAIIIVDVNGSLYSALNEGNGTWILPEGSIDPPLEPGNYKISVSVGDLAGNLNADSDQGTLTILKDGQERSSPFPTLPRETVFRFFEG